MRRREALVAISGAVTTILSDYSEADSDPATDFSTSDIDSPSLGLNDESASNPELTEVTHTEIWRPREPNVLAIFVSYGDVDHSKSYSIHAQVGSDDSANGGSVEMDRILDRWYPGRTGMVVPMPEEEADDYSFSVPVTVTLFEGDEEVDVKEDLVML